MRTRERVAAGGAVAAALVLVLAGCGGTPEDGGRATPTATATGPQYRTDVDPMARRLPDLTPIVSADWLLDLPGHGGSRIPGPSDFFVHAVLKLRPGAVAKVLATAPAANPPTPATPTIPAALAGHAPAGAQWVRSRALDEDLTRASDAELYFDAATDTVYVSAANLGPQDKPAVRVRPDGTTTTVPAKTPTPAG